MERSYVVNEYNIEMLNFETLNVNIIICGEILLSNQQKL